MTPCARPDGGAASLPGWLHDASRASSGNSKNLAAAGTAMLLRHVRAWSGARLFCAIRQQHAGRIDIGHEVAHAPRPVGRRLHGGAVVTFRLLAAVTNCEQ